MKSKYLLITLLLIGVIFISGCIQQTPKREYVCSDGSVVSDPKLCPKGTVVPHALRTVEYVKN